MKKAEYIKRYGEVVWEKVLQQRRDRYLQHHEEENARSQAWNAQHCEKVITYQKEWREVNPDKVKAYHQEEGRKGGKRYLKHLKYNITGLQGKRNRIRMKHRKQYWDIKQVTPNCVFHHEWLPGTANFKGVALVEKVQHQHGHIDVIQILEGKITLLTEEEIRNEG